VWIAAEDIPEEWRAGAQDHFVCLDLTVITGESNIEKVFLFPEFSKSDTNVRLKVVPAEAEFLRGAHTGCGEIAMLINLLLWLTSKHHPVKDYLSLLNFISLLFQTISELLL